MKWEEWTSAGVAVCATLLLVVGLVRASRPSSASSSSGRISSTTATAFVVKAWEGQLAVFAAGTTNPIMIYGDVAIQSLPPEEQIRLREGITLPDRAALHRLLEDYTG